MRGQPEWALRAVPLAGALACTSTLLARNLPGSEWGGAWSSMNRACLVPELYGHDLALELRLFRPDDTPVAITSDHCSGGSLWTGNYGRIVANCVPSGPYRIRVEASDGRIWEKNVEVRTYQRGETRLRTRHLRRGPN